MIAPEQQELFVAIEVVSSFTLTLTGQITPGHRGLLR